MKKYFLILSVAMAIFACKPTNPPINNTTCLPEGWQPLDTLLIKKYFVETASNITYKDNSGKTLMFNRNIVDIHYSNTFCDEYSKDPDDGNSGGLKAESYTISYTYETGNHNDILEFCTVVTQRFSLDFWYSYSASSTSAGRCTYELEQDKSKDEGLGWPKDPEAYKAYFTDRIQLKNISGAITGELVAGKGLAWFTDDKGVKWTLQ